MSFVVCVFLGINVVGATNITIDPNNNIEMPNYLYSDKANNFTISGLTTYESAYQIKDVSDEATLIDKIDTLMTLEYQRAVASEKYTAATTNEEKANEERNIETIDSNLTTVKNQIKTLVDDYEDTATSWTVATNNAIPNTNITKNKYYVVWIKATAGENSSYEYGAYKAIATGEETAIGGNSVSNPATGIETTVLYVGVALLIIIGSSLVMNKNKEKYE